MNKFITILTVILFSSCSFLDESSQDEMRPSTVQDYDKILMGEGYAYKIPNFMSYHDILTDDVESYPSDCPDDENEMESIARCTPFYTWDPTMFDQAAVNKVENYNAWEILYSRIKNCNVVLNSIDNAIGDNKERANVKAQALSLRAFYYYMLVNIYCDPYNSGNPDNMVGVPWIANFHVSANFPKRSTLGEIYRNIIKDLDKALELYELSSGMHQVICRATDCMAHGLASRVYMQMEEWDKVLEHSNAVLAKKSTLMVLRDLLDKNYTKKMPYTWDISTTGFGSNKDTIDFISPEFIWGYCSRANLENYFTKAHSFSNAYVTNRAFAVSTDLMNLYEYKNTGTQYTPKHHGDLRVPYFFIQRDYYISPNSRVKGEKAYYGVKGSVSKSAQYGIRTAEIYLNRAEALIHLGKLSDALQDLNKLRLSRWSSEDEYVPFEQDSKYANMCGSQEGMLQLCKDERRRELAFEHIRWFDLRRYGRPRLVHKEYNTGSGQEVVLEEGDARYTIPLPREVIERNPNL